MSIRFEPNLSVVFSFEGKGYVTGIEKERVYKIVAFDHVWDEGTGRVINISYDNMAITVDCSTLWHKSVKEFKLSTIQRIFEISS